MVEPITLGLGAAIAYISKDGVEKLLGPTADYLGKSLAYFTEKRVENVGRIFKSAENKLGERINSPGQVPPKVLRTILNEGSYSSDFLSQEYFGGILASSRTEQGRDDRGARLAKVIDGLSTYQLRAHYLIYSTIKNLFTGKGIKMDLPGRERMQIYIPATAFVRSMELSDNEQKQISQLIGHIFFGLLNEGLIDNHTLWGSPESLNQSLPNAPEHGIICRPSAAGTELFLSAFGCIDKELSHIFEEDLDTTVENVPKDFSGAIATRLNQNIIN